MMRALVLSDIHGEESRLRWMLEETWKMTGKIDGYFFLGDGVDDFAQAENFIRRRDQLDAILASEQGGLLTVGVLGALWSSSAALTAIIDTLNRAYDIEERRPWWKVRLLAIALTAAPELLYKLVHVAAIGLEHIPVHRQHGLRCEDRGKARSVDGVHVVAAAVYREHQQIRALRVFRRETLVEHGVPGVADDLAVALDDNADGVLIAVRGVGRAEAYAEERNFNAGVKEHIVLCPCIARAERGEHVHRSQHRNGAVCCEQPVERAEVGVVVVDMGEDQNVDMGV